MIKYIVILSSLFVFIVTGCQTHEQKAYTDALKQGEKLIEGDTITIKVGEKVLYSYSFSAGVQPIYYTLKVVNSDSNRLGYLDDLQFYVGEEDLSGGPCEGIHVFHGKQSGLVRLEFYNPYYNEMQYTEMYPDHWSTDRAIMEFYKAFTDSAAVNAWTEAQYADYYNRWEKLPQEARSAAVDTLLQKFEIAAVSMNPIQKQKVVESLAKRYALRRSGITNSTLDTLFNTPNLNLMETWHQALEARKENLPIHENLETTVCYVQIEE